MLEKLVRTVVQCLSKIWPVEVQQRYYRRLSSTPFKLHIRRYYSLISFAAMQKYRLMCVLRLGSGVSCMPHLPRMLYGTGKSRTLRSSSSTFAYGGILAANAVAITLCISLQYCQIQG